MKSIQLVMMMSCIGMLSLRCGSDGGRDDDNVVKTVISGTAYLRGPLTGIEINVHDYRDAEKGILYNDGGQSIQTDSEAAWSVGVGSRYSDMVAEADWPSLVLRSVVHAKNPGAKVEDVAITPITHLAAAYTTYLFESGTEPDLLSAKQRSERVMFEHFGDLRHGSLMPKQPNQETDTLTYELIAGMLLGSLESLVQSLSQAATLEELIEKLADDIEADGLFNGKGTIGPLFIGNKRLTGDTLRPFYSRAIVSFLQSEKNKSGFTEHHLDDIIQAIKTRDSEIFPGPPTIDEDPPTVTILQPGNGETVSGTITIHAQAEDNLGIAGLVLEEPSGVTDRNDDNQVFQGELDTTQMEDGELRITFLATDDVGNISRQSVTVMVQNLGKLSGRVFKGFVSGATVTAYRFDTASAQIASTTTDAEGRFSLEMGTYEGPVLVVVTSGRYTEEATATEVDLDRGDYLSAALPAYSAAYRDSVTVSPLTTWAAEYAAYLLEPGVCEPANAAMQALSTMSSHFGGLDLLGTEPVDLLSGENCSTLNDKVLYSLYCAGISQLAMEISVEAGLTPGVVVTAISLTDAVAEDISDGVFNGMEGDQPLSQGERRLSSYTVRTYLARAVNHWLASSKNPCSVAIDDFRDYANGLAEDDSSLFPEEDDVIPVDDEGPAITFQDLDNGERVAGAVVVRATAQDMNGVVRFEVLEPAGAVDQDMALESIRFTLDTTQCQEEESIIVRLEAEDSLGKVSIGGLWLVADNAGPVFTFEPEPESAVNQAAFSFTGTVSDPAGVAVVTIQGEAVEVDQEGWFRSQVLGLLDGLNLFQVFASDLLGNETHDSYPVYLDRVLPEIQVESPTEGQSYHPGSQIEIRATASDSFEVKSLTATAGGALLEDLDPARAAFGATILSDNYAEGALELRFEAEDMAGNVGEKVVTIYILKYVTISGKAFKSELEGALVRVYDWSEGLQGDNLTAEAGTTGQDGSFSAVVNPAEGPWLVKVTGGAYKGEGRANYDTIQLEQEDYLLALVNTPLGVNVEGLVVTPFSTMAAIYARHLALTDGMTPADAMAAAVAKIESVFEIRLDVEPLNCREQATPTFSDSAKVGLLLAGLSWISSGNNYFGDYSALQLLRLVYQDLEDGLLDGKRAGGVQLQFPNGAKLDANTLRATMARGVYWFMDDSSLNGTGLLPSSVDIFNWLDSIAQRLDPLFDPNHAPLPLDVDAPVISLISIEPFEYVDGQGNTWVRGTITIRAEASDPTDLVASNQDGGFVVISPNAVTFEVTPANPSNLKRLGVSINTAIIYPGGGAQSVVLAAKDRSGNESTEAFQLMVDNQEPAVSWAQPVPDSVIKTGAGHITCSGSVEDFSNEVGGQGVGVDWLEVDGVRAQINGTSWSVSVPVVEGENFLSLIAVDKLGNEVPQMMRRIVIDTDVQAPTIRFISHSNNQWVNGTFNIVVEAEDNRELSVFEITEPAGLDTILEIISQKRWRITVRNFDSTSVGDGSFSITYRAVDAAQPTGNERSSTLRIRIDNTDPSVVITYPADGQGFTGNYEGGCVIEVRGNANDGGGSGGQYPDVIVKVENRPEEYVPTYSQPTNWEATDVLINPGDNYVEAIAEDPLGNESSTAILVRCLPPCPPYCR